MAKPARRRCNRKREDLTVKRIFELLSFDKSTGVFRWKVPTQGRIALNSVAGTFDSNGYSMIMIDGRRYKTHVLVFYITHNRWPAGQIDHVNGISTDNRPENLRECLPIENSRNIRIRKNSKSGCRGVTWHKRQKKWNVRLGFHGKSKHFGCFDDLELAVLVAEEARDKYYGDFSGNERSTYANLSKEM
ncbi:HNH endonuclease [Salmonella enterica subsp. enterica serovar Infantis]